MASEGDENISADSVHSVKSLTANEDAENNANSATEVEKSGSDSQQANADNPATDESGNNETAGGDSAANVQTDSSQSGVPDKQKSSESSIQKATSDNLEQKVSESSKEPDNADSQQPPELAEGDRKPSVAPSQSDRKPSAIPSEVEQNPSASTSESNRRPSVASDDDRRLSVTPSEGERKTSVAGAGPQRPSLSSSGDVISADPSVTDGTQRSSVGDVISSRRSVTSSSSQMAKGGSKNSMTEAVASGLANGTSELDGTAGESLQRIVTSSSSTAVKSSLQSAELSSPKSSSTDHDTGRVSSTTVSAPADSQSATQSVQDTDGSADNGEAASPKSSTSAENDQMTPEESGVFTPTTEPPLLPETSSVVREDSKDLQTSTSSDRRKSSFTGRRQSTGTGRRTSTSSERRVSVAENRRRSNPAGRQASHAAAAGGQRSAMIAEEQPLPVGGRRSSSYLYNDWDRTLYEQQARPKPGEAHWSRENAPQFGSRSTSPSSRRRSTTRRQSRGGGGSPSRRVFNMNRCRQQTFDQFGRRMSMHHCFIEPGFTLQGHGIAVTGARRGSINNAEDVYASYSFPCVTPPSESQLDAELMIRKRRRKKRRKQCVSRRRKIMPHSERILIEEQWQRLEEESEKLEEDRKRFELTRRELEELEKWWDTQGVHIIERDHTRMREEELINAAIEEECLRLYEEKTRLTKEWSVLRERISRQKHEDSRLCEQQQSLEEKQEALLMQEDIEKRKVEEIIKVFETERKMMELDRKRLVDDIIRGKQTRVTMNGYSSLMMPMMSGVSDKSAQADDSTSFPDVISGNKQNSTYSVPSVKEASAPDSNFKESNGQYSSPPVVHQEQSYLTDAPRDMAQPFPDYSDVKLKSSADSIEDSTGTSTSSDRAGLADANVSSDSIGNDTGPSISSDNIGKDTGAEEGIDNSTSSESFNVRSPPSSVGARTLSRPQSSRQTSRGTSGAVVEIESKLPTDINQSETSDMRDLQEGGEVQKTAHRLFAAPGPTFTSADTGGISKSEGYLDASPRSASATVQRRTSAMPAFHYNERVEVISANDVNIRRRDSQSESRPQTMVNLTTSLRSQPPSQPQSRLVVAVSLPKQIPSVNSTHRRSIQIASPPKSSSVLRYDSSSRTKSAASESGGSDGAVSVSGIGTQMETAAQDRYPITSTSSDDDDKSPATLSSNATPQIVSSDSPASESDTPSGGTVTSTSRPISPTRSSMKSRESLTRRVSFQEAAQVNELPPIEGSDKSESIGTVTATRRTSVKPDSGAVKTRRDSATNGNVMVESSIRSLTSLAEVPDSRRRNSAVGNGNPTESERRNSVQGDGDIEGSPRRQSTVREEMTEQVAIQDSQVSLS